MHQQRASGWLLLLSALSACAEDQPSPTSFVNTSSTTHSENTTEDDASATSSSGSPDTDTSMSSTQGENETSTTTEDETNTTTEPLPNEPPCEAGTLDCACFDGQCQDGLICEQQYCVWAPIDCEDVDEPDNTRAQARELAAIVNGSKDWTVVEGMISGEADVDWLHWRGKDEKVLQSTEPRNVLTADADLRFCVFLECVEGTTEFYPENCPAGTSFANSPIDLLPGCCGITDFIKYEKENKFTCDGEKENVDVYVRIDQPNANICTPYTYKYMF